MKRIGPGPAKYSLPPTLGCTEHHDLTKKKQPCYSIGIPLKYNPKSEGPGPGGLNIRSKTRYGPRRYPEYMGIALNNLKRDPNPGPARYRMPEQFGETRSKVVYKKMSPEFSFGYRTVDKDHDRIPGPKYSLPPMLGERAERMIVQKGPCYSMGNRLKYKSHIVSPGPANYKPKIINKNLGTTMGYAIPKVIKVESPGANKYNLQEYKPKYNAPSYSIGFPLNGVSMPLIVAGDND